MNPCRRAWRFALAAWLACLAPLASASTPLLRIDATGLSPAQREATQAIVDEAARRLPPAWRESLAGELTLQWRDDLPTQVHGRAKSQRLWLRRSLLEGWMARPANAGADDPATRAALAALIHELAHFHDRSPQGHLSKGMLSRDPRLLDLAGWQVRPLHFGLRAAKNLFSDRTPDRYELTSPKEFVAVNLEWFLLDPQYACRRPALFRYFSEHFHWQPVTGECAPGQVFLQADPDFAAAGFEQIDPARIYAVDYLLAEGNDETMSRWGHSMLRLVVCAPGRPPGPDCRLDLRYHRVLSFRAFVGDVQISGWRGLTGRYPSRLFLLPLDQVIDEYTKIELRGLQSIPLRLQRNELAGLLERAAQLHWSYDGRYYFIGNNCAVETWRLLHDGVPRLASAPLRSITPTGLLRKLERAGIADASVLDDRNEAMRQGYYFEPMSVRYQSMYEVARTSLRLPQARAEDWLDLPPSERTAWLPKAGLRASAALLLLEEAALRREELKARDAIKRQLLKPEAAQRERSAQARDAVQEALAREAMLMRPAALGDEGYGLPQQERGALQARAAELSLRVKADWQGLRQAAREGLPAAQRDALAGIEKNLATLGTHLRELNRKQGGLQLPGIGTP